MWGIVRNISERKLAEEKVTSLAKFPSENPNPVLRVAKNGEILYSNNAALPLLAAWNSGVGKVLPDKWYRLILGSIGGKQEIMEEFKLKDQIFSVVITPVADAGYVNSNEKKQRNLF